MKTLDKRYKVVKVMIENGAITEFRQIFEYIPKSIVANDLGTNYNRLIRLLKKVEDVSLEEIFKLSEWIDIECDVIFKLLVLQYEMNKGKSKTRP